MTLDVYNNTYSKEIHPGAPPFYRAKEFRAIPGNYRCCAAFPQRRASTNRSKGQEVIIHDNSCDCHPSKKKNPQKKSFNLQTKENYFISIEQSTGHVQVKNMVFSNPLLLLCVCVCEKLRKKGRCFGTLPGL